MIRLEQGDIIWFDDGMENKFCILSILGEYEYVRYAKVSSGECFESSNLEHLEQQIKWLMRIGPNLEKVERQAGWIFAIIACHEHLPEGYLGKLSKSHLEEIQSKLSRFANIDYDLKEKLKKFLKEKK